MRGARQEVSPLPLRLVHAGVFCLLGAAAVGLALEEWRQLVASLSRPFHTGEPPGARMLLGSALAGGASLVLLVALARARSAPLSVSLVLLGGFFLCWMDSRLDAPVRRGHAAANLRILETSRALHQRMVDRLQREGEVPREAGPWLRLLEEVTAGEPSPVRERGFARLPYRLARVEVPDHLPSPLPATLYLWVSSDGATFQLHPAGLEPDGRPTRLLDDRGSPLVLTGLFNPQMQAAPSWEQAEKTEIP
jgi:hypothetical protein